MQKLVDYDQLYPGRFIKAGDFQGKDVTLTIANIEVEELAQDKGGDKPKGVLSFKETKKKLVLNRTNGECIKGMFGRTLANWIGKRVTFYPAPWNGEIAVRVKGSPDLEAPVAVEVRLPRKRPTTTTMQVTGKSNGANGHAKPAPVETPPEEVAEVLADAAKQDDSDIQF
jgi:hypothetical protein